MFNKNRKSNNKSFKTVYHHADDCAPRKRGKQLVRVA